MIRGLAFLDDCRVRGPGADLALTNGRADFSAEVGAPAIRPGPQATGPALRLPRTAPGGSLSSALRRRKCTFTRGNRGGPVPKGKDGDPAPCTGSALTPPAPQVARLPRSNGWD